ncbi:hypothetical protein A3E66_02705 [Candidatus Daviesbacteria bacterium RIFCSPHIGHO2_12_FULL_37_16]|uniref:Cache domain-containing protein n=2 Tax=Candidatus Daviesiibacteriota TaxID=1752718 RepID=A0A0G0HTQ9_9BACT|nr:MAG: hypothetical protein US19_C0051G0018 [Candidatus Daviesbacteria bacterium GW2011_GWB1_36_5]OGE31350.1 MAG: hypothetical protein A3C99_03555 [Candidatus Daviesbacteria bacterium RIFCSPHIGHO2_02_FULL_37_9]OGE34231.1 MAG: hypothetical protein A3E66_02705 [Candidatus Daviesbacteria bacterium RIFCSPHIGHO2_12_FULL_37_16]
MVITSRLIKSWIFWLILFLIVVRISFVFIFGQGFRSTVTEQLLSQKQIIARAEASNASLFFEKFGDSVAVLAQLNSIEKRDASVVHDMDTFMEQHRSSGFVGGVVLTDKNGVVQFNSNILGTRDLDESLADRDYFIWDKDQAKKGEYFISDPVVSRFGASKGQTIVVVASPVYQNGVFMGVVAASVKLEPLAEHFFGLMKLSDQTQIHLFDAEGDLLYSNSEQDSVGLNISNLFSADQTLRDGIKGAIGTSKEGQIQTQKYLSAYSPVELGTQNWLLVISSSMEEVEKIESPFRVRQTALSILAVFTLILFGVLLLKKNQA